MLAPNELNSMLSIREGIAMIGLSEVMTEEITVDYLQSVKSLIQATLADNENHAIVITIGENTFLSRINELKNGFDYFKIHSLLLEILHEIEGSKKPVIAAIESSALDVTLEFTLHCHYRVASVNAKVGFASVKNGLIPGLGGTQLLPRLIGIEAALNMLHRSSIVAATELADSGLFDELLETDATTAGFALAQCLIKENKPILRTSEIKINLPHAQAFFDIARMNVGAIHKGNAAAMSCVDCIEAAVLQRIDKGLKFEHLQFRQHMMSYLEHNNSLTNSGEIA